MEVIIQNEIASFPWSSSTWLPDKLLAASPFRYDNHPSFYVYLVDTPTARAGDWGDSGATDPEWQRGGFPKLLAFLRNETVPETLDYLRAKYEDGSPDEDEEPALNPPRLTVDEPYRPLDSRILDAYRFRHPYLAGRGISEEVQRLMRVGYDRVRQAIVLPWFNPNGSLGNIKFRKVDGKTFWYVKGGRPIREMVYGIDVVYRRRIKRAAIVEAEIDAMTLWTAGIPAIATGGTGFGAIKREIIAKSPLEEIVVVRDNDTAGRRWQRQVVRDLIDAMDVSIGIVPRSHKDINDTDIMSIGRIIERRRKIYRLNTFLKGA